MSKVNSILFLVTEDWYFVLHRLPIARAAQRSGYRVLVATQLSQYRELLEGEGFTVIPMVWRRNSMNPLHALGEIRQITAIYRNYKPDLVHHVALRASLYGSIAARLSGTAPVVNNLAGLGHAFSSTGRGAAVVRQGLIAAFRLLFRGKHTCTIVENSDDLAFLIDRIGLPEKQAVLIRSIGVDEQRFAFCEEQPQTVPAVVMVSRLIWPKGVRELVEAGRILRARGISVRVRLVGKADKASSVSVPENVLQAWHDQGDIEWLGHQDDIPRIWAQAAIAVLPSYYREGIPRSLLEAAACGRPVVTTDMPGCREIIEDGVNGYLVVPRDVVSLADALEKLIKDPSLRDRMGRAGRERVLQHFTERHVVAQTLDTYQDLLERNGHQ
jgi:glycosyltransferase involved in cell wall biosynthesis